MALWLVTASRSRFVSDSPDNPTPEPLSVPSFATLFAASQTGEDGEGDGEAMTPYSWHDTFVLRLEELLEQVCGDAEARESAHLATC